MQIARRLGLPVCGIVPMKFFLVIANGPRMGLPIHIDIDLFLLGSTPMCRGATASAAIFDIEVDGHGNRKKDLR